MKRIFLLIAIILPLGLMAQNSAIDKLFDKYSGQDGFTTVNISGKLLALASQFENDDPTAKEMLQNITGIRVLAVEDESLNKELNFVKELKKDGMFRNISKEYELLLDIKEKDQIVKMFVKEAKNQMISELLLVVGGDDNAIVVINGLISFNNISKLGSTVNIGGMKHLKQIKEKKKE
ncbi:DUF4252 domain-containing protein [Prolixibacteraceae bacterium JC049]|nr:DUF4252 domain-containing protein [Prolixibacteraceae bacterium JC049]